MSILAEPRRKQRISVDPRNLQWKNDSSKFGTKMLEKMGWKDGGGLGKKEQGRNDNIKLKANYSGKGLGCESSYDDTWVAHHDDFANLLHTLNEKKDDGGEGDADKNDVVASEKSKKSRSRVRYRRFKELSEYSEEDKCAVFGTKKRHHIEADGINDLSVRDNKELKKPKLDEGNVIRSSLTVNEYFAEKMKKLQEMNKLKR